MPTKGQDDVASTRQRDPLCGLKGVHVVVEKVHPGLEQAGLTQAWLQTLVQLRLRKAGIRVLDWQETVATVEAVGGPILAVNMSTTEMQPGIYSYVLELELSEAAQLMRDPSVTVWATTWHELRYGTCPAGEVPSLKERLPELVDKFINDYLAANPITREGTTEEDQEDK
jgi:hypothetical protein